MAKEVEEFPPHIPSSKYLPLLDGKIYRLDKGVDYESTSLQQAATIRQAASVNGCKLKVRIKTDDVGNESIFLQVVGKYVYKSRRDRKAK